jgi:hypothetical protein
VTERIDRSLLAQQVGPLLGLLAELEPALGAETIVAAVREAAALPAGQRRIAQEVVDRPELLTGQAAAASLPGVLRFIDVLVGAGATTVVAPLCPHCGRQRPLGRPFNGLRLCAAAPERPWPCRAVVAGSCGPLPAATTTATPSASPVGGVTPGVGEPARTAVTSAASPRRPRPGRSAPAAARGPSSSAASAGAPVGAPPHAPPASRCVIAAASAGSCAPAAAPAPH